jgi:hypothetical protein
MYKINIFGFGRYIYRPQNKMNFILSVLDYNNDITTQIRRLHVLLRRLSYLQYDEDIE